MKILVCLLFSISIATAQPLQLHPDNTHYFLYKGTPAVLITSGEHYGAVLNLDFDYDVYLETLQNDDLNLTRLFTGSYVEKLGAFGIQHNTLAPAENKFLAPWARSDTPGYINGGNKFDLDAWNKDYFARLHDFIAKASQRGVIVEVVFFSSIYTDSNWRYCPMHPDNNINTLPPLDRQLIHTLDNGPYLRYQEALVKKIVQELNDYDNIYYEIQNEPWADQSDSAGMILEHLLDDNLSSPWQNRIDLAAAASLAWQRLIAGKISDQEKSLPKKHLIAQNYCNFKHPLIHVDSSISVINFHYALPEAVTLNYSRQRPVAFDESGFAGSEPAAYRRQAWRFILSGGAVFSGLDYSFYPGHEKGDGELSGPGGGGPELRRQLSVLRRFIQRFDLSRLKPDCTSILHHPGLYANVLSTPGEQCAAYFEGRGNGTLVCSLPANSYRVTWFNVISGQEIASQMIHTKGQSVEIAVPSFQGEIAMEIRI